LRPFFVNKGESPTRSDRHPSPSDFRKSVHTLTALASEALRATAYCGNVFVFRSKRMDVAVQGIPCSSRTTNPA
jgi:hypothetical protein